MTYEADDASIVKTIRDRWEESKKGLGDWRSEAKESYAFRSGDQWTQQDLDKLKAANRPAVTFDRIGAMVNAVHGLEVNNRQELRYYPRGEGDAKVNEDLTAAAKWARDECFAEDEESEAFEDAIICGVGCTETRMDYEEDADGKIIVERKDPLHMFWDPSAKRRCLEDAKYCFNAEWILDEDGKARWGEKWENAFAAEDVLKDSSAHNADRAFLYEQDATSEERREDEKLVLHYQCWKLEPYYRALDPFTQKVIDLSKEDFEKLQKRVKKLGLEFVAAKNYNNDPRKIPYLEQKKKVYYRAFLVGEQLLEDHAKSPCQDGFTWRFITGRRDRNKNMWYGIVRAMKDPQRWGNKFFSMSLDIVSSNTKGGAFIEEGALVDKRKAEDAWAASSPLILLNEGGIDKVKERQAAAYPTGFDRLMMFAFDALPFVSGLNLEAMGLADRAQAGVLEAQRRQAAVSLLAPLFDALRRYRKSQGKLLLAYIRKYLGKRLVRILGPTGDPKYIQLALQAETAEYDVVVDQAPSSPDYKEKVWSAFKELLPIMLKQGYPIPPAVWEYTPLPSHVAAQMKAYTEGYIPPAIQAKMQQMQQQLQQVGQEAEKLKQENLQLKVDNQVEIMKIQGKRASDSERTNAKMIETQITATVERITSTMDNYTKQIIAQAKMDSDERKQFMDSMTKIKLEAIKSLQKPKESEGEKKFASNRI